MPSLPIPLKHWRNRLAKRAWARHSLTLSAIFSMFSRCCAFPTSAFRWNCLLLNAPCWDNARFSDAWTLSTKFRLLWCSAKERRLIFDKFNKDRIRPRYILCKRTIWILIMSVVNKENKDWFTKIERPVLLLQNTLSNDGCVKRYKNSLIARNVVSELQKEVCHWINSICTTLVKCVVWIAYLFPTLTRILAGWMSPQTIVLAFVLSSIKLMFFFLLSCED